MILIIGGSGQGKLEFATGNFQVPCQEITDCNTCGMEKVFDRRVIYGLHMLIKRLLKDGADPLSFFAGNAAKLKDKIIISDEVGLGVVPMEPFERSWREAVGRVCCNIAKDADEVYRIYAGIPSKLKGAQ